MIYGSIVTALLAAFSGAAMASSTPPPILDVKESTHWTRRHEKSKFAHIKAPFTDAQGSADSVDFYRLDMVGDNKERGFAHGALMAREILEFVNVKLNKYYADYVLNIEVNTDGLPEPLQKALKALKVRGAVNVAKIFNEALEWTYYHEEQYLPTPLIEEMEAIAEGMCYTLGSGCNVTEVDIMIKRVNMLPELIRMACTAFGAWGKATDNGRLIQTRALDFGAGPFGNYTVLQVHRPTGGRAFAAVGYPGMVGVVTGIAQDGIGVSEKVWMVTDKLYSLQPGSYDGEADVFVLRDILEKAKNRKEAEEYLVNAKRTWGIWIGIGDFESQVLDLVGYQQSSSVTYTDVTMPSMTSQPYIENIAYVDKNTQPSYNDKSLPDNLQKYYGNITLENARLIIQNHETGDAHIAMYDFGLKKLYFSFGRINSDGKYCPEDCQDQTIWRAYNRPYVAYDLEDLWHGR